jgi:hypothetical protein
MVSILQAASRHLRWSALKQCDGRCNLLAVASLSHQRAMSTWPAMPSQSKTTEIRFYLDLRRQLGGCKPAMSATRSYANQFPLAEPFGSVLRGQHLRKLQACRASSRRRCVSRSSREVDWTILLRRSMLVSPSMRRGNPTPARMYPATTSKAMLPLDGSGLTWMSSLVIAPPKHLCDRT